MTHRTRQKILNSAFFAGVLLTRPALIKVVLRGVYLPVFLQFEWLRQYGFLTAIDVGASTGQVSRVLMDLFPGCTVYAFEPIPDQYARLKRHAKSHRLIAMQSAVGNTVGVESFFVTRSAPSSSLLRTSSSWVQRMPEARPERLITVACTTLDDFFGKKNLPKPIFLKIDVQGGEKMVLEGGRRLLEDVSMIHLESSFEEIYEGQAVFADLYDFLTERGFVYFGSTRESEFYPQFGLRPQENSIFVRDGSRPRGAGS